jgi:hypothetical protein
MRITLPPAFLEVAYTLTERALSPFRRWLRSGGAIEGAFVVGEIATKGPLFGCRMCGQCVLHQTGMTCPMNCPKEMRNGPCGGVRPDGRCEVRPEMECVWVQAWERSKAMPRYGAEILHLLPPVDRRRQGRSAWIRHFLGAATPPGWTR